MKTPLVALAATLLLPMISATPQAATTDAETAVTRVAGETAAQTAASASQHGQWLDTAIVVSDRTFADALSSAPLAGVLSAPILLTDPSTLDEFTAQEVGRLAQDAGGLRVVVVGGDEAVSPEVVADLAVVEGVSFVDRIAGQDRYQTATLVSTQAAEEYVTRAQSAEDFRLMARGAQDRADAARRDYERETSASAEAFREIGSAEDAAREADRAALEAMQSGAPDEVVAELVDAVGRATRELDEKYADYMDDLSPLHQALRMLQSATRGMERYTDMLEEAQSEQEAASDAYSEQVARTGVSYEDVQAIPELERTSDHIAVLDAYDRLALATDEVTNAEIGLEDNSAHLDMAEQGVTAAREARNRRLAYVEALEGYAHMITSRARSLGAEDLTTPVGELDGGQIPVFITDGEDPVSAAVASAAASAAGGVVLLSSREEMPPSTLAYLGTQEPEQVYAVGAQASRAARSEADVTFSGPDAQAISAEVAEALFSDASVTHVAVASDRSPADAVVAAGFISQHGGPLLLTSRAELGEQSAAYLDRHASTLDEVFIFGGPDAVSHRVQGDVRELLGTPAGST